MDWLFGFIRKKGVLTAMENLRLYHLKEGALEKTIPLLVSKIYESGKSINIVSGNIEQLKALDTLLWTYTPISFLPHGCEGSDSDPDAHPIWLSTQIVSNKDTLVLLCDSPTPCLKMFSAGILFFQTEKEKQMAEDIVKQYSEAETKRWIQTEKGWDPY
jgi:DNA polymerase III subunit chi